METSLNEKLCIQCGNRGFTRTYINNDEKDNVPVLKCITCQSILYDHNSMEYLEHEKKR